MKQLTFIVILFVFIFSCKKDKESSVDKSGSLLDSNIDTTWKAPDGSTINIKITTYYGPKELGDNRNAYHADLSLKLLSGNIKNITIKLTYRHFPKDYSEYEASTGYSYPVDEEAYSTINVDPSAYPAVQVYGFIPDPGPIDRIEISP